MKYKKFDMHCHTREGSPDSSVSVLEYAGKLKEMGFGGMLVTDHNSYGGYLAYQKIDEKITDFVVLRGVEYDTFEYGHMIIILPTRAPERIFRLLSHRGMHLHRLVHIVHAYGGIIGPAHPGGEPFLSFAMTRYWRRRLQQRLVGNFDFIEGYNACEPQKSNDVAVHFANCYRLPMTGGSDAHWPDCVGAGYTRLPEWIRDEDSLIAYYKQKNHPVIGGTRFEGTLKDKLKGWNLFLVMGFFFYNKTLAFCHTPARLKHARKL